MNKFLYLTLLAVSNLSVASNNTDFKVNATVVPGCLISMNDVNFGVIEITKELIEKVEASNEVPTARVLYYKIENFNYQCPNGTVVNIRSNGERNMINQSDPSHWLHYDVKAMTGTGSWGGIHTNPISKVANGKPKFLEVNFSIMSPFSYGTKTMPLPGVYTNSLPMQITF